MLRFNQIPYLNITVDRLRNKERKKNERKSTKISYITNPHQSSYRVRTTCLCSPW